jgi:hypothetical protein
MGHRHRGVVGVHHGAGEDMGLGGLGEAGSRAISGPRLNAACNGARLLRVRCRDVFALRNDLIAEVTVSRNEVLCGLDQAEKFILAIVLVDDDASAGSCYLRNPFTNEPDFGVACVNYDLSELLSRAARPAEARPSADISGDA